MAREEKGTNGKWRADIMVNGKRKQKICANEKEAKDWCRFYVLPQSNKYWRIDGISLSQFWFEFKF